MLLKLKQTINSMQYSQKHEKLLVFGELKAAIKVKQESLEREDSLVLNETIYVSCISPCKELIYFGGDKSIIHYASIGRWVI